MGQPGAHGGEEHEHTYVEIEGTENISIFEEQTHHQITLHWHPRGLALSLNYAEALELADALQRALAHIAQGRRRNGG
ncbi:MAG: hypothetical protein IRZ14_00695 [Chloroflexi bacterium]|jgi:hypothetical protein|nr:hypothetical protein [Chloroflexota bacterium]